MKIGETFGDEESACVHDSGAGTQVEIVSAAEDYAVANQDVAAVVLEKQVIVHCAEFLQS